MNCRDRFLSALHLEIPDRVPLGELLINDLVIDKVLGGTTRWRSAAERNVACHKKLGHDMVPTILDGIFGVFPDSHGGESIDKVGRRYTWDEGTHTWWYMGGAVKTEQDLERYNPDPSQEELYETTRKSVEIANGDLAIVGVVDNTELTSQSMGIDHFCRAFYRDQGFLQRSLEVRTSFAVETAKRMIELGVDAIISCDDMAYKIGPMVSPRHYKEFILPHHKRFASEIGKKVPVLIHCDGNVWPLLDLFLEAGFDGIHALEPIAGMDIEKVKEKYGDRWCLMGNVDCTHTLCDKSQSDVVRETKHCIESAAPGGGYILSSSNSLHNAINVENYKTMIDAAMRYGRYPV